MSKAFTREDTEREDDDLEEPDPLPAGIQNLMTPAGHKALVDELEFLTRKERPRITEIVFWAAGNGDRSENGDYLYNKKRLREIDRRMRYLTKRLDKPEIVDPRRQQSLE
jgi:transcription elongation factor GreB